MSTGMTGRSAGPEWPPTETRTRIKRGDRGRRRIVGRIERSGGDGGDRWNALMRGQRVKR